MGRLATAVCVALVGMASSSASALEANKACADGFETFQRLFIDDSAMAANTMRSFKQRLTIPDDLTFSDVVEAIRQLGAERVVSEAAEYEARRNGLSGDDVTKAKSAKLALWKNDLPALQAYPALYDHAFVFRGVTAVAYDAGLDRATCQARYSFDWPFIRRWMLENSKKPLPDDVERIAQLQQMAEKAGQTPTRLFAVQPDGRGHVQVILLSK